MPTAVRAVYILSVEESNDYIFTPSAVVIVPKEGRFQLFCSGADHNRIFSALMKLNWSDLEEEARFKNVTYRISNAQNLLPDHYLEQGASIAHILQRLYVSNPRHLFFLSRYFQMNATPNP
ncbi:hypothetical protein D2Q93_15390 [Alicyclobacillaceae bacterium I2511]|nr:hypothetical protein D2Q93_15390 [Alicyclobacillaceae bacterium I2511]